jgi:ribosomal protein L11 methyltransferase
LTPYRDLHVYLLSGEVSEADEKDLGAAFLGNWVEDGYSFLFFETPSREAVSSLLSDRADLRLVEEHRFTYEDWQGGGLDPIRVGPLLITPPWVAAEARKGEIKMLLDPGMVFGTALHPTTRHCLEALCFFEREGFPKRVLDLGTGTGILALAAGFLGAREVLAVDLNPLCVKTAGRNVALNGLEGCIRVLRGRAEDHVQTPADLVIANLHYAVLKDLMGFGSLGNQRRVLLSGFMRSQAGAVKENMGRLGFHIGREWDHEMTWYTMLWGSGISGEKGDRNGCGGSD